MTKRISFLEFFSREEIFFLSSIYSREEGNFRNFVFLFYICLAELQIRNFFFLFLWSFFLYMSDGSECLLSFFQCPLSWIQCLLFLYIEGKKNFSRNFYFPIYFSFFSCYNIMGRSFLFFLKNFNLTIYKCGRAWYNI